MCLCCLMINYIGGNVMYCYLLVWFGKNKVDGVGWRCGNIGVVV